MSVKHIDILAGEDEEHIVGSIDWEPKTKFWNITIKDNLSGATKVLLTLSVEKIYNWFKSGRLPYPMPKEEMRPWEDESWDHIRKYFIHWIKLGSTK